MRQRVIVGEGAGVDLHARAPAARAAARGRPCRSAARSARRAAGCCASTPRERRILMVAGVAAGIAAVFRTPLGAALLAVEVLYRDDFEVGRADPGGPRQRRRVLGRHLDLRRDRRCSRTPGHFPFIIKHLPLYALLALLVSALAVAVPVVAAHRAARDRAAADPALGAPRRWAGWRSGVFCVPIILFVGWRVAQPGPGARPARRRLRRRADRDQRRRLAADRVGGRRACSLLLCLAKLVASSLTIGSGGSAGDFAPVAGDRRPVRRRVRPRGAAAARRSAHRSGRVRAGRRWARSTAASRTCRCRRWCWSASWRAATTCSCR